MSIQGLTGLGPRLPEIGKLFKGAPKETRSKSGKEYQVFGKELDHWRFESKNPLIARLFAEAFAEDSGKPRHIPVFLPFASVDGNFQAWKEAYTASGIQHRCDGETCVLWLDPVSKSYRTDPIACPTLGMSKEEAKFAGCKAVGRLQVVIPALNQIGCVTVETHSKYDIRHLDQALHGFQTLRGGKPSLRDIPFVLSRVETEIDTPSFGKTKKWLVRLAVEQSWAEKYLSLQGRQSLMAIESVELLPDGTEIEEGDGDGEPSKPAPLRTVPAAVESSAVHPNQISAEAHSKTNAALLVLWKSNGKSETEWADYFEKEIKPLTYEQKEARREKWQQVALDKQAKVKAASASVSTTQDEEM